MAYGCGYVDGYQDLCEIVINVCASIGWGGGPWGWMPYGGGEFCSGEAADAVIPTPASNVRDYCIVRC